jgi:hypothetical protein
MRVIVEDLRLVREKNGKAGNVTQREWGRRVEA